MEASQPAAADYDLRGMDIDQRYAKFCNRPLSIEDVYNFCKASIVSPSPNGIAGKLFLASRSECAEYAVEIRDWAITLGEHISNAMFKPKGRKRRVQYSRIDSERVRKQAALDGAAIAMYGHKHIPTLFARRVQFNVDEHSYRKIRDFVGGCVVNLIANFRYALEWAWGYTHCRAYDTLWKTLSPVDFDWRDSFSVPETDTSRINRIRLREGQYLTPMLPAEGSIELPIFTNDRGFYDDRYEARMRAEAREAEASQSTETLEANDTRGGQE